MRLNLTLDDEHAELLRGLADRTHMQPGTLARSMLQTMLARTAIEEVNAGSAPDVLQVLDGIDGAYDRMMRGRKEASSGDVVALDAL